MLESTRQFPEVIFILVCPEDPRNIGAAARAMNTMGFDQMRLINPCEYQSGQAKALAHRSRHILESAQLFNSLSSALEDIDLAVATTVRHRQQKFIYHDVKDLPKAIAKKGPDIKKVGLVFGPEKNGLSNENLMLCDLLSTIPTANPQPSLNLSQAIMVYAHILSQVDLQTKDHRFVEEKPTPVQYGLIQKDILELIEQAKPNLKPTVKTQIKQGLARLNYEDFHLVYGIQKIIQHQLSTLKNQL